MSLRFKIGCSHGVPQLTSRSHACWLLHGAQLGVTHRQPAGKTGGRLTCGQ